MKKKQSLFEVINGVKQGGVISPFLFSIYIDELIVSCISLNIGSKLYEINTSVISFCDDLNLLSPSVKQVQQLLDICSTYGENWKIKFNPTKSNIREFGKKIYKTLSLTVNGKIIEKVKEMKILGYWFDESLNSNKYVIKSFGSVRKSFFSLNMFGMKPNGLNPFLQAFLYNTYCLSKSTY